MVGRRKTNLEIGMSRLYVYEGKRTTTYYTIDRHNKYINLGHDLREAKKQLLELEGEAPEPGTIADYLDDLMKYRKRLVRSGKLSSRTVDSNEAEVIHLKEAFGKMTPKALKASHIWLYMHKYRGLESPIRANREIALLSTMFNGLLGADIVDRNPCVGVERNAEIPRDRLVTDGDLRSFMKYCWKNGDAGKRIALAAYLSYLTGKAQGQILKLTVDHIQRDGIDFAKRKRGANTFVEWTKLLRRTVDYALSMPAAKEPRFVVHNQAGDGYTESGFKALWHRRMGEWCKLGHDRFTFHDLRAKTVTDMSDQGRKASDLTGHRQESTIARVYDRRRVRKSAAVQ
ncbi:hypothetical protein [Dechloromonas denitrificans]|uniref:hypothetical protein n=1 Tax=Dechloromonas denitrificans TaxID=281362 RepID=UPI001CF8412E|nr:hypothetical protein [Dechloromonas denitrificans]